MSGNAAANCPAGHASADDQFCEVCGLPIGAAPMFGSASAPAGAPGEEQAAGAATVSEERCPRCGRPRDGNFCESCGHDFTDVSEDTLDPAVYRSAPPLSRRQRPAVGRTAQPPSSAHPSVPGGEWTAVVSADRAYYDTVQAAGGPDAAGIAFPAYFPQRRFRLTGAEVRIGRHSVTSGIDPEIDLSVPPADPGVSRLHAVLLRSADGNWSVVDPGSANGTAVNGSEIARGQAVPLRDGDRINLGAWTELRVVRGA